MKTFGKVSLVLLMFVTVMSCGLSSEETDLVADEIVNTLMAPMDNLMDISTMSLGDATHGMVAWVQDINTNTGISITFQTNSDNGLSFSAGWVHAYFEASATLSSNANTLAYGHGLADVYGQLLIDDAVVSFPADQEGIISNFMDLTPSTKSVAASLYGNIFMEASGHSDFVTSPFEYSIQFGHSQSNPFSARYSMDTNANTVNLDVTGLLAYAIANNALVGSIDYNFDLHLLVNNGGSSTTLSFSGDVSGEVVYNDRTINYTLVVINESTVEITIEGKTVTKSLRAIARLMNPVY